MNIKNEKEYMHYTGFNLEPKHWTNAVTAKDASEFLKGMISESDLLQWADDMLCPHFRVNGGVPLFHKTTIKDWVTKNRVTFCEGKPLCNFVTHRICATENYEMPDCLLGIEGIIEANLTTSFSGVYFLCKGGEVVYVGQAVAIACRIGQHAHDGEKDFDSVFCIPVTRSMLDNVEHYYIRHFLPEYNKCAMAKKAKREAKKNART